MAAADFEPGHGRRLGPPVRRPGPPGTIHQPPGGAASAEAWVPGPGAQPATSPAWKGLHAPDERDSTLQAIAARKTLGIGDPRRSFLHSGGLS